MLELRLRSWILGLLILNLVGACLGWGETKGKVLLKDVQVSYAFSNILP